MIHQFADDEVRRWRRIRNVARAQQREPVAAAIGVTAKGEIVLLSLELNRIHDAISGCARQIRQQNLLASLVQTEPGRDGTMETGDFVETDTAIGWDHYRRDWPLAQVGGVVAQIPPGQGNVRGRPL